MKLLHCSVFYILFILATCLQEIHGETTNPALVPGYQQACNFHNDDVLKFWGITIILLI